MDNIETPPVESAPASRADETQNESGAFLKSLGLTFGSAKKILANGRDSKYLNTKITARVLMIQQANGIEEIMISQKAANRYSKNPEFAPKDRVACLGVVAQCGIALARLSEISLTTARALDVPSEGDSANVVRPVQNNFFGFPPVVQVSTGEPKSPATNGSSQVTDVMADVKSA